MDLTWLNDGVYHWCKWKEDDSNTYDYHIRLASNSYHNGGTCFNLFGSNLPNIGDTKGGEKVAVLNGGIWYTYNGSNYNQGAEVAWYYNTLQEDFGQYADDCLAMGTWGGTFDFGTQGSMYGSYPLMLTGPARSNGTGTSGVQSTRAHSFIGKGSGEDEGVCYMGYCCYANDAQNSGQTGAQVVAKMTGKYGGTCMVLDGGGSTQMQYMGTTKTPGDGRYIKNAIVLYRVKKAVKTYTISTSASPSQAGSVSGAGTYDSGTNATLSASANSGYLFSKWSDGSALNPRTITVSADASYTAIFERLPDYIDNDRLGSVAGTSYVLSGSLKKANPWYSLKNSSLKSKPSIYMLQQNGSLKPLILKYLINYNLNGGQGSSNSSYYFGDTTSLQTPTHSNYDGVTCKFEGWFKDSSFSNKIISIGSNATGNRDLYAKWSQSKTQYKGTYIVSGESQIVELNSYKHGFSPASYSGQLIWSSSLGYQATEDTKVKTIFVNLDYCNDDWEYSSYKKPAVYYGYCDVDEKYTQVGQLYEDGEDPYEVSVDYTIPANCYFAIKTVQNEGRTVGYCNGGNIVIDGSKSYEADWQDDSNPPQGSWASGSPQTRSMTRYYDGSSWTNWKEG